MWSFRYTEYVSLWLSIGINTILYHITFRILFTNIFSKKMIISTLIVIGVIFVGAVIYGVVTVPFSTIGTRGTNDIPVAFAPDEVDEFMTALVMS